MGIIKIKRIDIRRVVSDACHELISDKKIAEIVYMKIMNPLEDYLDDCEKQKVGEWIRTGRTNVYGGEELMCPFCGDRVMVQNIKYELYCRQCGELLGDKVEEDEVE